MSAKPGEKAGILSTPSLGITKSCSRSAPSGVIIFQLPLSGSRPAPEDEREAAEAFQLPLSGSPGSMRRRGTWFTSSFQLPLSGSREAEAGDIHPDRVEAFNSLSRDHRTEALCRIARSVLPNFQLPLSGSLSKALRWQGTERNPPFNSLSRDHRARFRDFPALRGVLPRRLFAQMIPKATIWIYRFAPL